MSNTELLFTMTPHSKSGNKMTATYSVIHVVQVFFKYCFLRIGRISTLCKGHVIAITTERHVEIETWTKRKINVFVSSGIFRNYHFN